MRLKRTYFIFSVLLLIFGLTSPVPAQQDEYKTVAVLGFDATGMDRTVADEITDYLREKINEQDHIMLMSREGISKKLKEFPYLTGPFIEDQEIIRIGRALDVEKVIAGNIGKIGNLYTISVKLYDTGNGESFELAESYEGPKELFLVNTIEKMAYDLAKQIAPQNEQAPKPVIMRTGDIKKPWYKQWYVWATVGGAAIIAAAIGLTGGDGGTDGDGILPVPPNLPKP